MFKFWISEEGRYYSTLIFLLSHLVVAQSIPCIKKQCAPNSYALGCTALLYLSKDDLQPFCIMLGQVSLDLNTYLSEGSHELEGQRSCWPICLLQHSFGAIPLKLKNLLRETPQPLAMASHVSPDWTVWVMVHTVMLVQVVGLNHWALGLSKVGQDWVNDMAAINGRAQSKAPVSRRNFILQLNSDTKVS